MTHIVSLPCGGCGNADAKKRCIGCLHEFKLQIKAETPYPTAHTIQDDFAHFLTVHQLSGRLAFVHAEMLDAFTAGRQVANWINTEDRVPEHGDVVLIRTNRTNVTTYRGQPMQHHVATFCKGVTAAEVEASGVQHFADEGGNNLRPYRWSGDGPCSWFGQDVTHWMQIPHFHPSEAQP